MRKVSTLVGLSLFALAGVARAQDVAPAADPAVAPVGDPAAVAAPEATVAPVAAASGTSYVARGLTQTAGNVQVTVPVLLNLSKDFVLKPVMVPLDVRYGVTDQLEVFLAHGSPVGFPVATPGGVCLGGTDRRCDKLYNNLSIGAQFSFLKDAAMELAGIGALVIAPLDPMTLAIDVGVNFKYNAGAVAIKAAPQVMIGANKRDAGNKESLFLPVQVAFQATPELAAFLDTGIAGPLDGFGDNYTVPVGIGASFAAMPNLDVGAEFFLPRVASGMEGNKAFDNRWLALFASWRMK